MASAMPSQTEPRSRGYGRIEEYQAILEDTAGISGRRQNTNDLFVGLNVVFLTGIGFLLSTAHFTSWVLTITLALIFVFTYSLNRIWVRTLKDYSTLLGVRHRYIEDLEREFREERGGDPKVGMILITGEKLYRGPDRKETKFGFGRLELQIARTLVLLYLAITILVAIATALVMYGFIPPFTLT